MVGWFKVFIKAFGNTARLRNLVDQIIANLHYKSQMLNKGKQFCYTIMGFCYIKRGEVSLGFIVQGLMLSLRITTRNFELRVVIARLDDDSLISCKNGNQPQSLNFKPQTNSLLQLLSNNKPCSPISLMEFLLVFDICGIQNQNLCLSLLSILIQSVA